MNRTDFGVALFFGALAAGLMAIASGFPPGVGPLPGPGFFPLAIGAVMLALAVVLAVTALRGKPAERQAMVNGPALATTVALLAAYLALWGIVPFAPRTFVLGVLYLRIVTGKWAPSMAVSAILTTAVILAFQYGLRVSLE